MWNKDPCIPRSTASSKKVGYQRAGTYTRPVVRRSSTSSRAPDESNSSQKKRAGIDSASQSRKFDRPPKEQRKKFSNEVVKHYSRSHSCFAATRNRHRRYRS